MNNFYDPCLELKPCPFCGGEAGIARIGNSHTREYVAQVGCRMFGCTVNLRVGAPKGHATSEWVDGKAIEKWNKRVEEQSHESK